MAPDTRLITPASLTNKGPSGPIKEHVSTRSLENLDRAEHALTSGGELHVLDQHSDLIFTEFARDRPVFTLAWPASWYIPIDADFNNYWVVPPPAENRYDFGWAQSQLYPPPTAMRGNPNTGQVYAYTALNPSDSHDSAYAGVGVRFSPSATLAYADVSIDADIQAHSRIWTLLGHPTSNLPTMRIRCTAYVCVWEIDLVTGAWELVRPFGSHSLVSRYETGLTGTPIQTVNAHYTGAGLTTRVQVQAGHVYAMGFQAQVDIDCDVKDVTGKPYQRTDADDWKLWADMVCSIPQITVTTKVLIP